MLARSRSANFSLRLIGNSRSSDNVTMTSNMGKETLVNYVRFLRSVILQAFRLGASTSPTYSLATVHRHGNLRGAGPVSCFGVPMIGLRGASEGAGEMQNLSG